MTEGLLAIEAMGTVGVLTDEDDGALLRIEPF